MSSKLLLTIVIVATATLPALAQVDTASQKTSAKSAAAADKSRARRATDPASSQPANDAKPVKDVNGVATDSGTKNSATPATAVAQEKPENPGEKAPEQSSAKPTTEVKATTTVASLSLREQIAAAADLQTKVSLQRKLADELIVSGNRAEAIKELKSIVAVDLFDPQGLYNAGNSLARLGASDEAIEAYRKAIEQRKGNYSRALNNLGVVLLRQGRWDESYEALSAASKLENFHYAEASYNLGRLFAARGQNDLALREWRRVLKIDPTHSAAKLAIANAGNEGTIVEAAPAKTPATRPLTNVAAASDKRTASQPARSAAGTTTLVIDPVSYSFLQQARSASERGKLLESVDNYQRLIRREGGYFAPANLELSYVLVTLKRTDEALVNLLQVANRDGARYPISYYHVARLYEMKGELKLAESAFAQAVAAYGDKNGQFLLDLSRVREKQGDFKGALTAMEQYVVAMNNAGHAPVWSDERLSLLRQKASAQAK
jgi:tetratricopeptide (TPR) repeat protein